MLRVYTLFRVLRKSNSDHFDRSRPFSVFNLILISAQEKQSYDATSEKTIPGGVRLGEQQYFEIEWFYIT